MDTAKSLNIIFDKYRSLQKPKISAEIESSEAFSYLYREVISIKNKKISIDIFTIITTELIKFEKNQFYFSFIEKILKFHNYNELMVASEISNISISGFCSQTSREKFYLYVSVISPRLYYEIFIERNYKYIFLYLRILESLFRVNDKVLLPSYIDTLINIMNFYDGDSSRELATILANYNSVFRLCADFHHAVQTKQNISQNWRIFTRICWNRRRKIRNKVKSRILVAGTTAPKWLDAAHPLL